MSCIFCKIVAGVIPCYKLAETAHVLAFLDIMPIARGHLLVVPKQHVELAYLADPALIGEMMSMAVRLGRAAQAALQCAGMNFLLNCGACAGQVVPHAHLHVVPRFVDDGIHWPWPQGSLGSDDAAALVQAITERMR